MTWQVIEGDCLTEMAKMEAGSFDAVIRGDSGRKADVMCRGIGLASTAKTSSRSRCNSSAAGLSAGTAVVAL